MTARQRGVALLTALLIAALAALLAVTAIERESLALQRTQAIIIDGQAWALVGLLEAQAQTRLTRDAAAGPADTLAESWAAIDKQIWEIGQGQGQLVDLQGRFNINNLAAGGAVQAAWASAFERLLQALEIDPVILPAVLDYLDADNEARAGGAEDAYYLRQMPPRRSADGPLTDVEELRAVRGMTPAMFGRLAPQLTALPEPTTINVNTADVPVLLALMPQPSRAFAARLRARQAEGGFMDVQSLLVEAPPAPAGAPAALDLGLVGVGSNHFALLGRLQLAARPFHFRSFLQRRQAQVEVRYRQRELTDV